jgi:rRNA processing protein Gar1
MNVEFIGFTLDVLGKVMVAFTAVMVHHRFRKEHMIDEKVFREMKHEQIMGIVGIILIIAGYLIQAPFKL